MAKNTQVLFEENDGWIIGPVEKVRPNVRVTISWNYLTFSPTIFLYLQSKKRKGNLFRMTYCVRVNRLCSTYYVMTVFLRRNKCRKWSVWLDVKRISWKEVIPNNSQFRSKWKEEQYPFQDQTSMDF